MEAIFETWRTSFNKEEILSNVVRAQFLNFHREVSTLMI